jgi:hypothetical protein
MEGIEGSKHESMASMHRGVWLKCKRGIAWWLHPTDGPCITCREASTLFSAAPKMIEKLLVPILRLNSLTWNAWADWKAPRGPSLHLFEQ